MARGPHGAVSWPAMPGDIDAAAVANAVANIEADWPPATAAPVILLP